jgi:hypothetical protein
MSRSFMMVCFENAACSALLCLQRHARTFCMRLHRPHFLLLLLLLFPSACSAKALSKYTDMVDSISREQLTKLADATDAARITLKQVQAQLPPTVFKYFVMLVEVVCMGERLAVGLRC